jgi:hypothetical protein
MLCRLNIREVYQIDDFKIAGDLTCATLSPSAGPGPGWLLRHSLPKPRPSRLRDVFQLCEPNVLELHQRTPACLRGRQHRIRYRFANVVTVSGLDVDMATVIVRRTFSRLSDKKFAI